MSAVTWHCCCWCWCRSCWFRWRCDAAGGDRQFAVRAVRRRPLHLHLLHRSTTTTTTASAVVRHQRRVWGRQSTDVGPSSTVVPSTVAASTDRAALVPWVQTVITCLHASHLATDAVHTGRVRTRRVHAGRVHVGRCGSWDARLHWRPLTHCTCSCTTWRRFHTVIRRRRRTTYVDAACCYRPSSVVCRSVFLSVCHDREPCRNGWTDRDAVLFGLWAQVGWRKRVLDGDAHWRHLMNTIEPSILTTSFHNFLQTMKIINPFRAIPSVILCKIFTDIRKRPRVWLVHCDGIFLERLIWYRNVTLWAIIIHTDL